MEWQAVLKSGEVVSSESSFLSDLLSERHAVVSYFAWCTGGERKIGCSIPFGCKLAAFKRNYVSTDGRKDTIFVLGWVPRNLEGTGSVTYVFLQPDGLVEVSSDKEFKTMFEHGLTKGS